MQPGGLQAVDPVLLEALLNMRLQAPELAAKSRQRFITRGRGSSLEQFGKGYRDIRLSFDGGHVGQIKSNLSRLRMGK